MRWFSLGYALSLARLVECYTPRGQICIDASFESPPAEWRTKYEGSGYTQWKRRSGLTPTSRTGPSSAFNQRYYWYVETNPWRLPGYASTWSRLPDDKAVLESPYRPGVTYVSFYYHMYGSGIGSLEVCRYIHRLLPCALGLHRPV